MKVGLTRRKKKGLYFVMKYTFTLGKFRCVNHRLPVVTGRYLNINSTDRICNLCPIDDIGDEFHYLFRCIHFERHREMIY